MHASLPSQSEKAHAWPGRRGLPIASDRSSGVVVWLPRSWSRARSLFLPHRHTHMHARARTASRPGSMHACMHSCTGHHRRSWRTSHRHRRQNPCQWRGLTNSASDCTYSCSSIVHACTVARSALFSPAGREATTESACGRRSTGKAGVGTGSIGGPNAMQLITT
jgi:hypothetical protein